MNFTPAFFADKVILTQIKFDLIEFLNIFYLNGIVSPEQILLC